MKSMNVNGTNPMVYFVKAIISFNVSLSDGRGIVSNRSSAIRVRVCTPLYPKSSS